MAAHGLGCYGTRPIRGGALTSLGLWLPSGLAPCPEDRWAWPPWCRPGSRPGSVGREAELWNKRNKCVVNNINNNASFQPRCYCKTLYSLPLVAVVTSQQLLVLVMGAELDAGVGHDPHHGGGVAPPQAEQPVLHVGTVDEPEGLLDGGGEGLAAETHAPPGL